MDSLLESIWISCGWYKFQTCLIFSMIVMQNVSDKIGLYKFGSEEVSGNLRLVNLWEGA